MKALNEEMMECTQGGVFWGNGNCVATGNWYWSNSGECLEYYNCKKFVFWVAIAETTVTGGCEGPW